MNQPTITLAAPGAKPKTRFRPRRDVYGGGITNAKRASRANETCRRHAGIPARDETEDYYCADLIGDIMHLCDYVGWDFEAVLATARSNHQDEL